MVYRISLLILCSFSFIVNCSSKKESESDLSSLPEEIQGLENLVVLENEGNYSVSIADSQNYGEVYLSLSPAAPSRGVGPKNAVDSNGNVFRYNSSENALQMFNNDGELVGNIGRKGRGPGEFQQVTALDARDGILMVYDAGLTRVSLFDIESRQLEKSISLPFESWDVEDAKYLFPKTFLLGSDGALFTALDTEKEGSSYFSFYNINQEGNLASSKIVETKSLARHTGQTKMGHNAGITLPFSTQGRIAISETGDIYHINTGEFLIRKYSQNGELLKSMYRPFEKDPLEEQEVLDRYHPNMHPVFDNLEYPATWPALGQIFIDSENRIWVSAIVDDHTIHKWFIIDEKEGVLATLDLSSEKKVVAIRNGKLYTERLDREAGMRVMTGYNLNFNKQE